MNPMFLYLALVLQLFILIFALFQLASIQTSTRESQENSAKTVLLLTVLANAQGATREDVDRALGK